MEPAVSRRRRCASGFSMYEASLHAGQARLYSFEKKWLQIYKIVIWDQYSKINSFLNSVRPIKNNVILFVTCFSLVLLFGYPSFCSVLFSLLPVLNHFVLLNNMPRVTNWLKNAKQRGKLGQKGGSIPLKTRT